MRIKKAAVALAIVLMLGIQLVGCTKDTETIEQPVDVSAWIVDWDLERGVEEIKEVDNLTSIQVFALYFNENDNVFLPKRLLNANLNFEEETYLTVVNDIIKSSGESIQKDEDLIRRILTDDNKKQQHIKELVSIISNSDFVGLELDYEKIDKDLADEYAIFIDDIGKELHAIDKKLRVVLEPRFPLDKVSLPTEYEYVVMAYNLYGYHSGPGPKADIDFIEELSKKTSDHIENARIAFSLGGFRWIDGENPTALTKVEAESLLKSTNSSEIRDKKSGAVYFSFLDDEGKENTIWYADNDTIELWMNTAKEKGISKFALWRMGVSV